MPDEPNEAGRDTGETGAVAGDDKVDAETHVTAGDQRDPHLAKRPASPARGEPAPARTVPPPGVIPGTSMLPPASIETLEAIGGAVGRLRDELEAATDRGRRSRLSYEIAEIQERIGDEQGAARDYLNAYNADTSFREPLEGLVRILERRRSLTNLGKLIDALVAAAKSPEEQARALARRATLLDELEDFEGARGAAREAIESEAGPADLGAAWLMLELVAGKLGDGAAREEALAGRTELTEDAVWRGLLLVDLAEVAAKHGDVDRALQIADLARAEGGAPWAAASAIERMVRADPGLPGSDDARTRGKNLADALEGRAEMIREAMGNDERGLALGVPPHLRSVEVLTDLFLRAADARSAAGELGKAARDLDRALEVLTEGKPRHTDESTATGDLDPKLTALEHLVLNARLRIAERMGETALASELAARRMLGETDGPTAASLAMRVAENAANEGDVPQALRALTTALERDPACAPARALQIDILEGSDEPARFAEALETLANQSTTPEARGRAFLMSGYVWATRARNAQRAREMLDRALGVDVSKEVVARLGRSLASLLKDDAWYESATRKLIEEKPAELWLLWAEVARLRLAKDDAAGAAKATEALSELPEGAWLGRVLSGFGTEADSGHARTALEALAESVDDPTMKRALAIISAMRAHAADDTGVTIRHLEQLLEQNPADPLVAAFLGDLFRLRSDHDAVARLAQASAQAADADLELRGARHLEAGFEIWKRGDKRAAVASFEAAAAAAPDAALPVFRWATRAIDADSLEGRRRALELAGADTAVALERFALEVTLGDVSDAEGALESVEVSPSANLRNAAALARLAWQRGALDTSATNTALAVLADSSPDGDTAAASERFRLARENARSSSDEALGRAARTWLDKGGGVTAALEWLSTAMATDVVNDHISTRRTLAEHLPAEAREAMNASAALLDLNLRPSETLPLVVGTTHAVRLANLELSPPGCDPLRRATTLLELDGALGEAATLDALGLGGWSLFAAGDAEGALDAFRQVTKARPDDLYAWEGMRSAAEVLGQRETYAVACEQLGTRCASDPRGAAFWEEAARSFFELGEQFDTRAEAALDASFTRDPSGTSFDKLFRRVRERKDGDKLLDLAGRRLAVTDEPGEIAKLYWEIARVLREKGDPEGALEALEHVTMFDENHVGALALTGEIFIRRGMFAEAAEKLSHLARIDGAPPKNRVTAGVAAVDLYENKLDRHDLALEVLLGLHHAKLSTLPVRERLARSAARTGRWQEATEILEELMRERAERDGRVEAARLALVIHRDRLHNPRGAVVAATKLLEEAPGDPEAVDLLVSLDAGVDDRRPLLERSRDALLLQLHEHPNNAETQWRLSCVARAVEDTALEQSTLSCILALMGPDGTSEQMLALLSNKKPRVPQVALTEAMMRHILAPGDDGAVANLFIALGPTLAEALGPTLGALGVHPKKDRVDPRAGLALRNEIAAWAGAFGIADFDLYIGGKDPGGVQGIPGETPAIVVGAAVNAPLSPTTRARVAREVFGIVRGSTVTRWRDDTTVAAIVVAACNLAKVPFDHPPFAVLAEVERVIGKAIARKTKAAIEPICRAVVDSKQDARHWASRARSSQARAAALACGDVSIVLSDVFGEPLERLGAVTRDDLRAHEFLRFVLSRPFFDLRRGLGLEG